MQSILEEFAYGNIAPRARHLARSPEFRDATQVLTGNAEKLRARLNADEKILFEKYVDVQDEVNRLTAVGNLVHGYRLGLIMAAEAFVGLDDLIANGEDD